MTAFVLDVFVLYAGVLATQAALFAGGLHPFQAQIEDGVWPSGWPLHLWVFVSTSLPFWLYYAALHSGPWQATLGKRLVGLRVTTVTGEQLSFTRALLRAVAMLIPFEVNHFVILQLAPTSTVFSLGLVLVYVLIGLYLTVIVLDPRRRSVHDLISGSVVKAR